MQDIYFIFQWWLIFFIIGGIFFPLTNFLFSDFRDRGYLFSKVIGIAFVSYTVFLVNTLHIFKFTSLTIWFVLWIWLLLNAVIYKKYRIHTLNKHISLFIFEEVLFLIGIILWSYVRAHEPSIHGLEKYMDFGFVNSILRTDYLPAKDMWFTPFSINYYYFGHFATALLTKLSALPSFITYNLMIATLFSFTFTLSFSLIFNIVSDLGFKRKSFATGILAGFLITCGGNLHTIYSLFKAYKGEEPVPFWTLQFLPLSFPNNYWYANATRFIQFTIHEFPLYSFVVSDLHGHVIDIPFVLLTLSLLYSMVKTGKIKLYSLLIFSLLLAIMYMTNAWDGLIYFLLASLAFFIVILQQAKNSQFKLNHIKTSVLRWFFYSLILGVGFAIFTLPFSIHFKPFVSGIGIVCAPSFLVKLQHLGPFLFEADHCRRSPFYQLLVLYGFFYFFVISFSVLLLRKKLRATTQDIFILLLIGISTLLIITPEFIYAKDIYPTHYRANTMFKLVYQSFMMLSLSSSYIIFRMISSSQKKFFLPIIVILCLGVLIYPHFAIQSYYGIPPNITSSCGSFSNPLCFIPNIQDSISSDLKNYKGLNGIQYLKDTHPEDLDAITWINNNISGQPVILEAQGDSYTDYARIASNTGLPTVLGWTVHEWLWRGTYDIPSPRIEEIKQMYEEHDLNKTKQLLTKHSVEYVYVSKLEKEKYPALYEDKFLTLGNVIYKNSDARLYKLH